MKNETKNIIITTKNEINIMIWIRYESRSEEKH